MTEAPTGTLLQPSEFDAAPKLRPDEPYFMLLGRDRLAPALVQKWATDNRQRALDEFDAGTINRERRDRELEKSTEAEEIGWNMRAFKAGDLAKRVKAEPTAKTYSGHELPEETKKRDALQSARLRCAEALHNAAGLMEMVDAAALECGHELVLFGLPTDAAKLRQIAEAVALKRPSFG